MCVAIIVSERFERAPEDTTYIPLSMTLNKASIHSSRPFDIHVIYLLTVCPYLFLAVLNNRKVLCCQLFSRPQFKILEIL